MDRLTDFKRDMGLVIKTEKKWPGGLKLQCITIATFSSYYFHRQISAPTLLQSFTIKSLFRNIVQRQ